MFLALLCCSAGPCHAANSAPGEYQVKAVFLFNFAQFVTWPPTAFADPQAPLCIGVIGDDPFGPLLDDVVRGETVQQRPLIVRRIQSPAEISSCHVLFVSRSESARLDDIVRTAQAYAVLTVGEDDYFAVRGGMIRFVLERNKIRFRINAGAAKAAGLVISSNLLRSATIVSTGGN